MFGSYSEHPLYTQWFSITHKALSMTKRQLFNVFVGAETGLLKGVNSAKSSWTNLTSVAQADRQKEIICLCWNDESNDTLCIARRDQTVDIHDTVSSSIVNTLNLGAGKGSFRGLHKIDSDYVTCTESGCLRRWSAVGECKIEVDVGDKVCCMRSSQSQPHLVATGGIENDLKIWNLDSDCNKPIFTAKNVKNDWLNLRVPVGVTDASFIPGSQQIVAGTSFHQVRLYDPASGVRRPQLEVLFDECPITSLSVCPNMPQQVIVGNAHGNMALVDLRGKGSVVQKYKGGEGSIRAVCCHPTQNVVFSCGLDRYLRIHDIDTRHLLQKVYLKSRLNCVVISKKDFTPDDALESIEGVSKVTSEHESDNGEADPAEEVLWSSMAQVAESAARVHSKKRSEIVECSGHKHKLESHKERSSVAVKKAKTQRKTSKRKGQDSD